MLKRAIRDSILKENWDLKIGQLKINDQGLRIYRPIEFKR
jgi:hypothetical protein